MPGLFLLIMRIVLFWVHVDREAQSRQKNKFGMSLQYLKENIKDEVYFLFAGKHQKFLHTDTIV